MRGDSAASLPLYVVQDIVGGERKEVRPIVHRLSSDFARKMTHKQNRPLSEPVCDGPVASILPPAVGPVKPLRFCDRVPRLD
jgi:hypothetical protein